MIFFFFSLCFLTLLCIVSYCTVLPECRINFIINHSCSYSCLIRTKQSRSDNDYYYSISSSVVSKSAVHTLQCNTCQRYTWVMMTLLWRNKMHFLDNKEMHQCDSMWCQRRRSVGASENGGRRRSQVPRTLYANDDSQTARAGYGESL